MTAIGSKLGRSRIGRIGRQSIVSAQSSGVTPFANNYSVSQGAPGAPGAPGAAGAPGPKILNGSGDPSNGLTSITVIGDYYLDTINGNLWERKAYTGSITPTTLINPGNVQWEKIAVLKGTNGTNGNKILVFPFNPTDTQTPLTAINDVIIVEATGDLWRRELDDASESASETLIRLSSDVRWRKIYGFRGPVVLAGDGDIVTNGKVGGISGSDFEVSRFESLTRVHELNGFGLKLPSMTNAQMDAAESTMSAGTLFWNSSTGTLRLFNGGISLIVTTSS